MLASLFGLRISDDSSSTSFSVCFPLLDFFSSFSLDLLHLHVQKYVSSSLKTLMASIHPHEVYRLHLQSILALLIMAVNKYAFIACQHNGIIVLAVIYILHFHLLSHQFDATCQKYHAASRSSVQSKYRHINTLPESDQWNSLFVLVAGSLRKRMKTALIITSHLYKCQF